MSTLLGRVRRLAALDTSVFAEVRDQPGETLPALAVVVIATFLADAAGLAPGLFVHGADLAEYFDFGALG